MIPIQTRVFDILNNQWLEGDSVLNLFTHPELHTTETLSMYLAMPSRYAICRWTGELLADKSRIFIGDILQDPRDGQYLLVDESGSRVFVQYKGKDAQYALQLSLADNPLLVRAGHILDGPPASE